MCPEWLLSILYSVQGTTILCMMGFVICLFARRFLAASACRIPVVLVFAIVLLLSN